MEGPAPEGPAPEGRAADWTEETRERGTSERATREARRGQAPWRRAGNRAPFSAQAARDADQGLPVMVTGAVPAQAAAYRLLAQMLQRLISPA